MHRLTWIPLSLLLLASVRPAAAQDKSVDLRRDEALTQGSAVTVAPTPEMWFYEQERTRYDDPKLAVRRKAEARGQQRADRLAAMKWYGLDNSRPTAAPIPWMSSTSPYWGSNSYDPNRWRPWVGPVSPQGTSRY